MRKPATTSSRRIHTQVPGISLGQVKCAATGTLHNNARSKTRNRFPSQILPRLLIIAGGDDADAGELAVRPRRRDAGPRLPCRGVVVAESSICSRADRLSSVQSVLAAGCCLGSTKSGRREKKAQQRNVHSLSRNVVWPVITWRIRCNGQIHLRIRLLHAVRLQGHVAALGKSVKLKV